MYQFHFEINESIGFSKLMNLNYVWMINSRKYFCLFPQTFYFGPFDIDFTDDLNRNESTLTA